MKQKLEQAVAAVVKEVFNITVNVELTRPDEQFGDFATNIALQLARQVGQNPRQIAEMLQSKITAASPLLTKVDIAGPGFLNFFVTDDALQAERVKMVEKGGEYYGKSDEYACKTVVAEYSDPNPFKVLHAGHLYTSIIGDAVANLLEYSGATVHRVNFGGDVGLHVGKTMWAIIQKLGGELPEKLSGVPEAERSQWMADAYVIGNNRYDEDETTKAEMIELNKRVYQIHAVGDHDSPLAQIYWTCRDWSYAYFNAFYESIGTKFEKYYPESAVANLGLQIVKAELAKGVFKESDGAIVFEGEAYGLHTRVFINSQGIPTYEAKDVGLIMQKWEDYHFDKSVVITGNEQEQYMAVVLKAVEQFKPNLVAATSHLTHGLVKLAGGIKMSSRKGNILRAIDVIDAANMANVQLVGQENRDTVMAAVKYAFLKTRTGGDIIYDPAESVSLQGNSGPYLQYAYVRALGIIRKKVESASEIQETEPWQLDPDERSLVRKMSEYPEVVAHATAELTPHVICTYLYELAQKFNQFYEHNQVIGDKRQDYRLLVVAAYAGILQNGLKLLSIPIPEKM